MITVSSEKGTDVSSERAAGKNLSDVAAPSLSGKDYWVALCTPPETASQEDIAAMLPTHLEWARSAEDRNQLYMAGPLLSGPDVRMGSGIMIFRAADEADARAIVGQDPLVTAGLRTFDLYQWQVKEGSVYLRLSLSHHSYDWR